MAIARKALSLEEFLQLPEEEPALEYFDGVVRQKVSPKGKHGRLQYRLVDFINAATEPAEIALALPEVRTSFAGESPVPDVSVYLWDRIPVDAEGEVADDFSEPPDIAIEILSPGQRVTRVADRCAWYVENGVQIALLVDPKRRTVRAFRDDGSRAEWRGSNPIELGNIVPGFALTVDELFASLRVRQ